MQYRPSPETLLLALGDFLSQDVRPALQDKALSFRVLIAANLARVVAMELACEEGHDRAELEGLIEVLGVDESDPVARSARRALIERLNGELARRIAKGDGDEAWLADVLAMVKRTLKDRLSVSNPRFSTAPEID
jgi:hypothetical protein